MEKKELDYVDEMMEQINTWFEDGKPILYDNKGNAIQAYVIGKDKNGNTKVLRSKKDSNKE